MAFFREVGEDIRNMVEKDPAARNGLEVLICYPGIWALIWHRPAHWLYRHHCPFLARLISQLTRFFTGSRSIRGRPSVAGASSTMAWQSSSEKPLRSAMM